MVKIIGIETSCDETAAAILENGEILSNVVYSQIDLHKEYGGVVPEIAARAHIDSIDIVIKKALQEAKTELREIDAVAATAGPGLIGGLIVGLMSAKMLASLLKKPFIGVNHLEAHLLTARMTDAIEFPYLCLLLSGGHCQILQAQTLGKYDKIGETIDDALGECFDKVARMLDLEYCNGAMVEKMAQNGDEHHFKLPKPLVNSDFEGKNRYNFSFSGLKTAVRSEIAKIGELSEQDKADFCASFQKTVVEILLNRLKNVLSGYDFIEKPRRIVICGGVAANRYIFGALQVWACENGLDLVTPPIGLCTDNAAMVAWAGFERFKIGDFSDLDLPPRAKWPLNQ